MRDVTIHVTGRAYSLGDLGPGRSRSKHVRPTSESHVEVEFTDEHGGRVRLVADCYFEPGYQGQIDIDISDGKVAKVDEQIRNY